MGFTHLQIGRNPWLGGYRPQIPVLSALCQLNLLNSPPKKISGYASGLDPVPLTLYVYIQRTRDLMRQIGRINWYSVRTIAIDETQFKALTYWWKLASTMQKENHLFSVCSITGKVARCVLSDGKRYKARVQWPEMCGVVSGWRCTMHDEWLVFYRACSGSWSVVQRLLSGWKCAVHVEWL
jgi:hypothetical protein